MLCYIAGGRFGVLVLMTTKAALMTTKAAEQETSAGRQLWIVWGRDTATEVDVVQMSSTLWLVMQ